MEIGCYGSRRLPPPVILVAILVLLSPAVLSSVSARSIESQKPRIEDLKSEDVGVRRRAATEFASASAVPSDAIPILLSCIGDEDFDVGLQAALALVNAGAMPQLTQALQAPEEEVRKRTAEALDRFGRIDHRIWPNLISAFRDTNRDVQWYSARALAHAGPEAFPLLVQTLNDTDSRLRLGALETLEYMGPAAKQAVPDILKHLEDSDSSVRLQAALTLSVLDPEQEQAVRVLIEAESTSPGDLRILPALGSFGKLAKPAVPLLLKILADSQDSENRAMAAEVLGKIHEVSNEDIGKMAAVFTDRNAWVRAAVARALGMLAPEGAAAIPPLLHALQDDYRSVRTSAARALANYRQAAVPGLIQASEDEDIYVRQAVVESLTAMKPLPPEAVATLQRMMNDTNEEVRNISVVGLRDAGIHGDWEAAYARAEKERAAAAQKPPGDRNRLYSKEEIIAPIPPDADHKYPLELEYLIPVTGVNGVQIVVSLHRGKDRCDRLRMWRQAGEKYQLLDSMDACDYPGMAWFDQVQTFGYDFPPNTPYTEHDQFLQIPLEYSGTGGTIEQRIFAILPDNSLSRVKIQAADEWYKSKLKPGEEIMNRPSFKASEGKLEFVFYIWNKGDGHCCPTAGRVIGTYKMTKTESFDPRNKVWIAGYQMSVGASTREPIPKR